MKGSTLIETIIYIALLAILMGGVLSSIYIMLGEEERARPDEAEINLLIQNLHE